MPLQPSKAKLTPPPQAFCAGLSTWLPAAAKDTAADHSVREICLPGEPAWQLDSGRTLETRLLELSHVERRLVADVRPTGAQAILRADQGIEMLVQRGTVLFGDQRLSSGTYLRLPQDPDALRDVTLLSEALVTVAIGQIGTTDTEQRLIDTNDKAAWFDGPVVGVEVLPLHGHGTSNVMLVRWQSTAAFQPNIDPVGEELYVLSGALHDSTGSYPAGSWIRNPVPAWQSWAGTPGTVVCYKSGHFPDRGTAPDSGAN